VVVDWNGVDGVVQFVVGLTKENVTVEMVDVGLPKRVDVTTVVNWIEVDGVVQKKVSASFDDPNSLKLMYKINNKRVIFFFKSKIPGKFVLPVSFLDQFLQKFTEHNKIFLKRKCLFLHGN